MLCRPWRSWAAFGSLLPSATLLSHARRPPAARVEKSVQERFHGGQEAPRSGKQALRHREEALATPSLRHTARRGHRNSGDLGCWATRGHEGWPREEADPVAAPLGDLTAPLCARSRRGREEALGAGLACHVLRPHAVLAVGVLEASAARRRRGICQALKGDASTGSYCKHA